jgi:hypothetical protein
MKANLRLGGMRCLYRQGWQINQAWSQREEGSKQNDVRVIPADG